MITVLNELHSVADEYLRQLRDVDLQTDRGRFERNLELLGSLAGYELSKHLTYRPQETVTPLGKLQIPRLAEELVLSTILRAGLPVLHGLHHVFTQAELAFVGAERLPEAGDNIEVDVRYVAAPELTGKTLILADTMLATGKSIVKTYHDLVTEHGTPQKLYIVGVIGSRAGVEYIQEQLPDADMLVWSVDPTLNDKFFIVPGLGDAGDLLYGPKL